MTLNPTALAESQRIAEAATQEWSSGVWYGSDNGGWAAIGPHHKLDESDWSGQDEPGSEPHQMAERDAAFLAHFNPARCIAMLEEIERLEKERDETSAKLSRWTDRFRWGFGDEDKTYRSARFWLGLGEAKQADGTVTPYDIEPDVDRDPEVVASEFARALITMVSEDCADLVERIISTHSKEQSE